MKIYIAGKITGLPRAAVELKFKAAATALIAEGHDVFYPTVLPDYASVPHEDYMHVCFAMIDICADWKKRIIYQDETTREHGFPITRR